MATQCPAPLPNAAYHPTSPALPLPHRARLPGNRRGGHAGEASGGGPVSEARGQRRGCRPGSPGGRAGGRGRGRRGRGWGRGCRWRWRTWRCLWACRALAAQAWGPWRRRGGRGCSHPPAGHYDFPQRPWQVRPAAVPGSGQATGQACRPGRPGSPPVPGSGLPLPAYNWIAALLGATAPLRLPGQTAQTGCEAVMLHASCWEMARAILRCRCGAFRRRCKPGSRAMLLHVPPCPAEP